MQNHELLTLRVISKQTDLILTFKLNVIKEKKNYDKQQKHCFRGINKGNCLNFSDVHGIMNLD